MAIHAHSTTVPASQRGLLRAFADAQPVSTPALTPETVAMLDAIESDTIGDTPEAVRSDLEALLADHGRALHFRRALHEAFDFGFALLDALDALDLSPLALDVIDDAIRTLDALDAPHEDLEPWLAGVCDLAFVPGGPALDAENDSEEDEGTALERHGRGFVRAGEDDAEDDDRETVNEDGSDWGEAHTPWWDRIGYPEMEVGTHV